MKIVLQKVNSCSLFVNEELISKINMGYLLLVGVNKDDTINCVEYLSKKIANMRLYKDEFDKLNKSILDTKGEILVVSNFTLQAEIKSGTRPSFSNGGDFDHANQLYLELAKQLELNGIKVVKTGVFHSHMHLETNLDGPFTIVLESNK